MKSIQECFSESLSLKDSIKQNQVDEGLKDVLNVIKRKFKQVFNLALGIFAKIGHYFATVTDDGLVLPVNAPVNLGSAYSSGMVDKSNTLVVLPKDESRASKLNTKLEDAFKLYGKGNSIDYWRRMFNESQQNNLATINENNCSSDYVREFIKTYSSPINEVKLKAEDPEAKYNRIVDNDQLTAEIKRHINNKHNLATLLIWGAPGIGKTAILTNIVNEIKNSSDSNFRCIVKTLSNETPDNFFLPKYADGVEVIGDQEILNLEKDLGTEKDKSGTSWVRKLLAAAGMRATDVPKTWLPVYKQTGVAKVDALLDEKCGTGMLFIDELSRATQQVLNVMLPLINERKIGDYVLGSGWHIVCASNRMEDEAEGQNNLGNALMNRFGHIYYEPTVNTWKQWAMTQGYISPVLLSWLSLASDEQFAGGKFFYWDPNDNSTDLIKSESRLMCTPRAWTNAMRELATFSKTGSLEGWTINDIPEDIIGRCLNKYIPLTAVDSFLGFLKVIGRMGPAFENNVSEVWETGRFPFRIDRKEMPLVAIPLAQIIISKRASAGDMPTHDEFVNLCKALVAANSEQLVACTLDIFRNVFFSFTNNNQIKEMFFVIHLKMKKLEEAIAAAEAANAKSNKTKADMTAIEAGERAKAAKVLWMERIKEAGYNSVDEIPDYTDGIRIVGGTYSEMKKYEVGGNEII